MTSNSDGAPQAVKRRGRGGRPRRPGVTDNILEATVELASEGGIDDLTLDAIAARAGVGRPTIYRRWPSKDALLEDAIERLGEKYAAMPQSGNIRDDLVEWARLHIQQIQTPLRSVWVAFFKVDEAHLAPGAVKRTRDVQLNMVVRAVERGELRADINPDLLVEIIFGTIWYQVTQRHREVSPDFAETIVDAVLDSWWADPKPRRKPSTKKK